MKKLLGIAGSVGLCCLTYGCTGAKLVLDTVGRVSAFQDIQEKDGYTANALNWFFDLPWQVPTTLSIITTAALLLICYRMTISASASPVSNTPDQSMVFAGRELKKIIRDNYVYGGVFKTAAPRFVGKFCENGSGAIFYLEYSFLPNGVMGPVHWSNRKKFEIYAKDRFAKDEDVKFELAYSSQEHGRVIWRFGRKDKASEPLIDRAFYRGRITVDNGQGNEQHTYFFMKYDFTKEDGPELIGQHIFDAAAAWEPPIASRKIVGFSRLLN